MLKDDFDENKSKAFFLAEIWQKINSLLQSISRKIHSFSGIAPEQDVKGLKRDRPESDHQNFHSGNGSSPYFPDSDISEDRLFPEEAVLPLYGEGTQTESDFASNNAALTVYARLSPETADRSAEKDKKTVLPDTAELQNEIRTDTAEKKTNQTGSLSVDVSNKNPYVRENKITDDANYAPEIIDLTVSAPLPLLIDPDTEDPSADLKTVLQEEIPDHIVVYEQKNMAENYFTLPGNSLPDDTAIFSSVTEDVVETDEPLSADVPTIVNAGGVETGRSFEEGKSAFVLSSGFAALSDPLVPLHTVVSTEAEDPALISAEKNLYVKNKMFSEKLPADGSSEKFLSAVDLEPDLDRSVPAAAADTGPFDGMREQSSAGIISEEDVVIFAEDPVQMDLKGDPPAEKSFTVNEAVPDVRIFSRRDGAELLSVGRSVFEKINTSAAANVSSEEVISIAPTQNAEAETDGQQKIRENAALKNTVKGKVVFTDDLREREYGSLTGGYRQEMSFVPVSGSEAESVSAKPDPVIACSNGNGKDRLFPAESTGRKESVFTERLSVASPEIRGDMSSFFNVRKDTLSPDKIQISSPETDREIKEETISLYEQALRKMTASHLMEDLTDLSLISGAGTTDPGKNVFAAPDLREIFSLPDIDPDLMQTELLIRQASYMTGDSSAEMESVDSIKHSEVLDEKMKESVKLLNSIHSCCENLKQIVTEGMNI